jgi:UDP-N-acetylmuramate--alanine ligase
VYNALSAIAIAYELGVPFCVVKETLENFKNANRRFEIKYNKEITIIDDYAHHPTEIKATIEATKEMYPGRRIIAVFQPHRYTRVFSLYDEFTKSFDIPDITVITDIYPAGESPIENVNGERLAQDIKERTKKSVYYGGDLTKTSNLIKNLLKKGDIILIMGAGSITKLSEMLIEKINQRVQV